MEEEHGLDILSVLAGGIITFTLFYIIRNYIKGTAFHEKISARGYVAIVTGANSGIGNFSLKFPYVL